MSDLVSKEKILKSLDDLESEVLNNDSLLDYDAAGKSIFSKRDAVLFILNLFRKNIEYELFD